MISVCHGSLFESKCNTLVNTVNCVGVMGAGIALAFKSRYPHNYKMYVKACRSGEVTPGKLLWVQDSDKLICNFPTKRHWRQNSRLDDIELGLAELRQSLLQRKITSIALPKLGCGNGGLHISQVMPLIEQYLDVPNVHIEVYL